MNLSVTKFNYMPVFSGKRTVYTDEYMAKTFIPYVEADIHTKQVLKEQNISITTLDEWAFRQFGTTFRKLYHTEMNKTLASRLRKARASGATLQKIAEQEGHSTKWVLKRFKDFNILQQADERQKIFEELVPPMIEKGYPLQRMIKAIKKETKAVKISNSILSKWINQTYDKSLPELRAEKKVYINKETTDRKYIKLILTNIFEAGHTLTEASEITGMPKALISHWIDVLGIHTKMREAKKLLNEILPLRMAQGFSPAEIAKEVGLSPSTVLKKAKKLFKTTFTKAQKKLIKTYFVKH